MSAYIEYVIVDNYVMTYLISQLTAGIMRIRLNRLRIHAACVVGTVCAVFYPFVRSVFWTMIFKLAVYAVLSIILFVRKPKWILCSLTFLAVTAGMGGVIIMIGLATSETEIGMSLTLGELPLFVLILPPLVFYKIFKFAAVKINRRRDSAAYEYSFGFRYHGETINANGYLDTGNKLYDKKTGLPVVLISLDKIITSLTAQEINDISECGGKNKLKFFTPAGSGEIKLIKPDNFRLYLRNGKNIFIDVMLGIVPGKIRGGYDAILSPAVIA